MASPERSHAQPPALSVDSLDDTDKHEHDLLQSLNSLSLATAPRSESNGPPHSARERRRSFVSPNSRVSSRSSLTGTNLNGVAHDNQPTSSPGLVRKASVNSLYSASGRTPSRPASRRDSSNSYLSPAAGKLSTTSLPPIHGPPSEEKLARIAASVASAYLTKELELLHGTANDKPAETVVILHDDCYGHRYSRPRASKNLLSTVVERPERIQAGILGLSMAYVRLGERHCAGKHPIHESLDPKSLPSIPFRIHKTNRKVPLASTAVTNVHGNKWMEELKIMCDSAEEKLALNGNELVRPEMNRGSDATPLENFHQGDLYLCSESLNALEGALGAVCEAVDTVFSTSPHKRAFVAVRPPGHHCSASFPSGFCWVNNVHVGIMHGILNHGLTHTAIIDFDLHHGDGSQAIAWQHNKRGLAKNAAAWKRTSIGYFSVHDINSYPCEYGDEEKVKNASLCIDNAHGQNIWNVHLQEWKSTAEFWKLYESKYSVLLEKTRNYLRLQTERFRAAGQVPKAAIFLSAGFDASEWEGAGMQRHKVNVPTEFYARLTRDVVQIASEEGLSVDGRVISVLEGGYSDRALYSGVLSHLSGLVSSNSLSSKNEETSGTEQEPGSKESNPAPFRAYESLYDPYWWSAAELDHFDAARVEPLPEPRKPRNIVPGNYSTPTQASNARMTDVAKIRRSLSNLSASQIFIPPTPMSPDIPWTTAAYELSKLLIPKDRQVDSCTHAELNTEATKIKKERQPAQATANIASDAPAIPAAPIRMSLRERKPVSYLEEEEEDHKSRRKTVSGSAALPTSKILQATARAISGQHSQQSIRRFSVAATVSDVSDAPLPTTASSRPGSSMSARPTSSMSMATQTSASATINVKKTRQPAAPKKQAGKAPRAPRKTKPDAASAETGSTIIAPTPPVDASSGPASSKNGSTVATASASKDVDQITNEMKKIKINVLTKEQKEARLKAKVERTAAGNMSPPKEEDPLTEQPLSPQTFAEAHSHSVPAAESKSPSQDSHYATPAELNVGGALTPMTPTIMSPAEPNTCSTTLDSSPAVQFTPEQAYGSDIFIPYQADGPTPKSIPIQGSIQILEPNTGTSPQPPRLESSSVPASPVRGRGHGFTATSIIPFSSGPVQDPQSVSKDNTSTLSQSVSKAADLEPAKHEAEEMTEHGE
ncbi:hypothetical protein GGS21DRAFT_543435 [Xylaria nigripes]|nr:hypothetical protein GGS21DRAFT_543435 [Xylaria nigripes]